MSYIIAHNLSREGYNSLLSKGDRVLAYYEGFGYTYIGVLSDGQPRAACLNCALEVLAANESEHHQRLLAIQEQALIHQPVDYQLLQAVEKDCENVLWIRRTEDGSLSRHLLLPFFRCESHQLEEQTNSAGAQTLDRHRPFPDTMRFKTIETLFPEGFALHQLIDPHTGIGKRIFRDASSAVMPMYCIDSRMGKRQYFSYGRTPDLTHAKYGAALEMIERYASMVPHLKAPLCGSYQELSKTKKICNPETLSLPTEQQFLEPGFALKPYDAKGSYRWTPCLDYFKQETVYLPEQAVYFDNQEVAPEARFLYETSNGCAVGGTLEEAIVFSLFEVVERDSFLVHWYNGLPPIRLTLEDLDNVEIMRMIQYIETQGYSISIFNITLETKIPAIWALVVDKEGTGALKSYTAAGAHLDPEKALEAALVEIITSLSVYNKLLATPDKQEIMASLLNKPNKVREMEQHVYFHGLAAHHHHLDFAINTPNVAAFKKAFPDWYNHSPREVVTLDKVISRFKPYHPTVYIANMENTLTQTMDLSCVKSIVPSMLTMTFGHQNRRINFERIATAPVYAGLREKAISLEQLNLCPHPFP